MDHLRESSREPEAQQIASKKRLFSENDIYPVYDRTSDPCQETFCLNPWREIPASHGLCLVRLEHTAVNMPTVRAIDPRMLIKGARRPYCVRKRRPPVASLTQQLSSPGAEQILSYVTGNNTTITAGEQHLLCSLLSESLSQRPSLKYRTPSSSFQPARSPISNATAQKASAPKSLKPCPTYAGLSIPYDIGSDDESDVDNTPEMSFHSPEVDDQDQDGTNTSPSTVSGPRTPD